VDADRAGQLLRDKCQEISPCELCGNKEWLLSDRCWTVAEWKDSRTVVGPAMPMVALVCQHCGLTRFINAIALGLIDANASQ